LCIAYRYGADLGSYGFVHMVARVFGDEGHTLIVQPAQLIAGDTLRALQGKGQFIRELPIQHHPVSQRPGARHHGQVVTTTPQRQPTWRQRLDFADDGFVGVRRQVYMTERVTPMGVTAKLADNHVGSKTAHQRGHQSAEGFQVRLVVGVGRKGEVNAIAITCPFAQLIHKTGAREESGAGLMQ
jgi:hypothetical protein